MRPILWKWVGIGALVALGIAWLAEVWMTTASPYLPWRGGPPAIVSAVRREIPRASTRPAPPGPPVQRGGTVIVVHPDGTAEQVTVGMGQTVVVDSDGSVHMVMSGKPRQGAWKGGPGDGSKAAEVMGKAEAVAASKAATISNADAVAASEKMQRRFSPVGDTTWTPGIKVTIGAGDKQGFTSPSDSAPSDATTQSQPAAPSAGESN